MNKWICDNKILIVGLGLMGGSYAKALKRLGYSVFAIDKNEDSIKYAEENSIIDKGYSYVDTQAVQNADVLIFALYPNDFLDWIKQYSHLLKKDAVITDVTGVKECIVYDIQRELKYNEFIAAHPMAGREVYGVQNADDKIFIGANFIVTPTENNTAEAIEWCKGLGKILGFSRISVLSPKEHDEMIGFLSQLTHCIAVALMTCSDNEHLVDYTGDSFRDLTRIARINDKMWSELFVLNKEVLIKEMDTFIHEFESLRDMLYKNDIEGLREKMRLSTKRRAYFDK